MKNIASGMMLALLLVSMSAVASNIEQVTAGGMVGVKAGDWIKCTYTILGWPSGTPYPEWLKVEFLSVEGTNATIRVTMRMSNGIEQSDTMTVDVAAGGGAFQGLSGFVIPANSSVGDSIYMSGYGNVIIAAESTKICAGAVRRVVCVRLLPQTGIQLAYYWDKQTGVLVEASTTSGTMTATGKATETNMWEPTAIVFPVHNVDTGLDYATIQEAVDAADSGNTIFADNGTYLEHIVVKKSLTLIGEDQNTTIIDGFGAPHVIEISTRNVSISGFTIGGSYRGPLFGYEYAGIYVEGTSANNTITGNIITANANGIRLDSTSNNTITNNIIEYNGYWWENGGIYATNSSFNIIDSNHIIRNRHGIVMRGSQYNDVENNIVENNTHYGISLLVSEYNNVSKNNVISNQWGIILNHAPHSLLRNNTLFNNTCNFGVYVGDSEDSIQDIDTSNIVNGKPVYYLINQSNLIIQPPAFSEIGYLAIIQGNNITVRDLALTKNVQGLLLCDVSDSIIENVSITHNHGGIVTIESNNNTIKGCAITNNKYIQLDGHSNIVNDNTISNQGEVILTPNDMYGGWIVGVPDGAIAVSGDNNTIFHNNFINNLGSPDISGDGNNWDDGYPSGGNYWNDYDGEDSDEDGIGDTPYVIDSNCQDRYPLMKPFLYHEYDLAVSLNTSHYYLTHGTSSVLEATVYNLGLNSENDVKLDLLIDDEVSDSIVIPELPSGSTYNHVLNHTWSPTVGDRYCNFTVFVDPGPDEKITVNNVATTSVLVCHRHDVAVVDVVPEEKWIIVELGQFVRKWIIVEPGQIVNIDAIIENNGTATENVTVLFRVTGKSEWIELDRSIVNNLAPTAETIVAFSLNTTGMIRGINNTFLIGAWLPDRISPFSEYPKDLKNNSYVFKLMVRPLDLDGDRAVNIVDIAVAAKAFETEPGDERWNPIADVNEDGAVNIPDISAVAEDFGKSY